MPFVDTSLTEAALEAVTRGWALELGGAATRLHGGEESAAFRIGDVVVRIGPTWRPVAELDWCHAVARAAAVEVPQAIAPLVNVDGGTVVLVEGRPVSVWPFVEGAWADDDDEDQWLQAAALLAELHRTLARASVGPRPPRSAPSADVAEVHDEELDAWLREFVARHPRRHPLHGDFYAGNLLVADGRIVALLDWDEALVGPPEQELAWAAWEWGGGLWTDDLTEVFEFVDEYVAAGGPASSLSRADLFRLVRGRLRDEVRYAVATERAGHAPDDDDVAYRDRQIEVFDRLRRVP